MGMNEAIELAFFVTYQTEASWSVIAKRSESCVCGKGSGPARI